MKKEFTRIAIKVGSNVLTRQDGTLDVTRMSALTDQIAALHKAGVEVIRELLPRDEAKYVPSGNSTA
jgi:glutamate 5-kinase